MSKIFIYIFSQVFIRGNINTPRITCFSDRGQRGKLLRPMTCEFSKSVPRYSIQLHHLSACNRKS